MLAFTEPARRSGIERLILLRNPMFPMGGPDVRQVHQELKHTGGASGPCMRVLGRYTSAAGSAARLRPGNRSSRALHAVFASSRARKAPRQ